MSTKYRGLSGKLSCLAIACASPPAYVYVCDSTSTSTDMYAGSSSSGAPLVVAAASIFASPGLHRMRRNMPRNRAGSVRSRGWLCAAQLSRRLQRKNACDASRGCSKKLLNHAVCGGCRQAMRVHGSSEDMCCCVRQVCTFKSDRMVKAEIDQGLLPFSGKLRYYHVKIAGTSNKQAETIGVVSTACQYHTLGTAFLAQHK